MHIAEFATKNPVVVNLVMVATVVIGLMLALRLPLELFPSIQLELVTVTTIYPGASAEDVEQLVSIPVEDEINDLSGIKVVRSTSSEGRSHVVAELEAGEDVQKISQDIRSEIAKIRDKLPDDAEEPIVEEVKAGFPILNVSIAGDVPRDVLRSHAFSLRDKIKLVPGVDSIVSSGIGDPVFWVRIIPEKLHQYRLSLEQVANAIRQKNLDLPGGALEQDEVEFLVRTRGRIQKVEDLLDIPVTENTRGRHVLLRDIARIELGEEKTLSTSRVNGLPAISFWINKQKNVDALETVEDIRATIDNFRNQLPQNIKIFETNDSSYWVEARFNTMVQSGAIGLVIVLIILAAFLNLRAAAVAALGLPVAFLGAFILMHLAGVTLNVLSMFGLILVLGILVDDAIIVVENIERYIQLGMSPFDAAVKGTKEVALPVIATILTNIAAFIPLLIATGLIGKFLSVIPKVAIFAMAVSLIEALFILPSHSADFLKPHKPRERARKWVYRVRSYYLKGLLFTIRNRYVTVGSFVLVLALSLFIFRQMPLVLFYTRDIAQFVVRVENPTESSLAATQESVKEIEDVVRSVVPPHAIKNVISMIGVELSRREPEFGDHLASVIVEYQDFEKRRENGLVLMNQVRKEVEKEVVGPARIEFVRSEGMPAGKPVDVRIQGGDFNSLKEIAERAEKRLENVPGVYGISDDLIWGKPEIKVEVNEKKAAIYGLDTTTVARAVRAAVDGLTVAQTRLGREEADVILKYDLPSGNIMNLLESYQIRTPDGGWVSLGSIVRMSVAPSMLSISRYDMERAVRVTAEIDQNVTTAGEVNSDLAAFLDTTLTGYSGYSYSFGGEEEETRESIDSIFRAGIIAVMLVYAILASILKSYTQPLIIMSVLPFAIIGVALGMLIRGEPFSIPALIGTVALLGIVVNDSLVLMDFINNRNKKMNRIMAVAFSAKHRFRPIVLTTITTFGGLASLMVKTRGESAFLAPMAVALGFGLVFATLITLFLIPSLYLILDDIRLLVSRKWKSWRGKKEVQMEVLHRKDSYQAGSESKKTHSIR